MTRPTGPLLIVLAFAAAFAACAEASGEIRGHDVVVDTSPQSFFNCDFTEETDAGDGSTWADLYRDLFAEKAAAGCGKKECHGSEQGAGFKASMIGCFDLVGCRDSFRTNLVRLPGDRNNPDRSSLVSILRHCDDDRTTEGIMPKEPRDYIFSRKSMMRVKAWIAAGAPD
jgi:hypothetical protein